MPVLRVLLAIGAGLALADASVVTLALPPMLSTSTRRSRASPR